MLRAIALGVVFSFATLGQQRPSAVFLNAPSSQILLASSAQLSAAAYDASGNAISSAAFTWSVSDKNVLSVDSKGVITALALGWSDVTANSSGVNGTLRVQVVPLRIDVKPANATVVAGESVQYSADVIDANGNAVPNVNLQWRVYGPNAGSDNVIFVDGTGNVSTAGWGLFYVEAYFNYTVGGGPFLPRAYGNTTLTATAPQEFKPKKLLDGAAVRQSFELRPRRGAISVNDSGQIAYLGSLEGFTTAALLWSGSRFNPIVQ